MKIFRCFRIYFVLFSPPWPATGPGFYIWNPETMIPFPRPFCHTGGRSFFIHSLRLPSLALNVGSSYVIKTSGILPSSCCSGGNFQDKNGALLLPRRYLLEANKYQAICSRVSPFCRDIWVFKSQYCLMPRSTSAAPPSLHRSVAFSQILYS